MHVFHYIDDLNPERKRLSSYMVALLRQQAHALVPEHIVDQAIYQ